jgi:serine/threonine protein kinase
VTLTGSTGSGGSTGSTGLTGLTGSTAPTAPAALFDRVVADVGTAFGVTGVGWLARGGQKSALACVLGARRAVVKVTLVAPGDDPEYVIGRARREAGILAAVDSPRVVGLLRDVVELRDGDGDGDGDGGDGDGDGDGSVYGVAWVEEYLDGVDVDRLLGPPWEFDAVARLVAHVGQALAACHRAGIVHRDLSPDNVRRGEDGGFRLMDPGLARYLSEGEVLTTFRIGTFGYQSPEHVPGSEVRPAGDVYVLGVLAYQALTGELPVPADRTLIEYLDRLHRGGLPAVESKRPDTPAELGRVVNRCLLRLPEERYGSGDELLAELRRVGGVFEPYLVADSDGDERHEGG